MEATTVRLTQGFLFFGRHSTMNVTIAMQPTPIDSGCIHAIVVVVVEPFFLLLFSPILAFSFFDPSCFCCCCCSVSFRPRVKASAVLWSCTICVRLDGQKRGIGTDAVGTDRFGWITYTLEGWK